MNSYIEKNILKIKTSGERKASEEIMYPQNLESNLHMFWILQKKFNWKEEPGTFFNQPQ